MEDPSSEHLCFLLEIPLRGFPFHLKFSENVECLKTSQILIIVQRMSLEI